jgi:prepilin-type processing-associated H-X9-DG protein
LPPGAGITAMRNVAYFDGHGTTHALLVLGIYSILGATGAITLYRLRACAQPTTASS